MSSRYSIPLLYCILLCQSVVAALHSYERGDPIPLYSVKIFSSRTQVPYSYGSLPFVCPPASTSTSKHRGSWINEIWRGDRPVETDYKITALDTVECKTLCTKTWTVEDAMKADELIQEHYQVEWSLDGLPGATASYTNEVDTRAYRVGFPLGLVKNTTFINNHVTFNILYTFLPHDTSRIQLIGFEIYPDSIADGQCKHSIIDYTMQQVTQKRQSVTFTYSVKWQEAKEIDPQHRWDMYIMEPNYQKHMYAMINNAIILLSLFGVFSIILLKTLRRDTSYHDDLDPKIHDDFEDVVGWRLIHWDVFRRPTYGGLFAPLCGAGAQLVFVFATSLACVYLGYCHPAKPGALLSWAVFAFVIGGTLAGYWSARIYKVFRGRSWLLNTILTSVLVPVFVFGCLLLQDMVAWTRASSLTVTVSSWFLMCVVWLLVLVPLTFLGAYLGDRRDRIEHPVRTTQMPRLIPEKRWFQQYDVSIALGGVIPFAVGFVQLHELLDSIWHYDFYLSVRYAITTSLLFGTATVIVTIVLVFFQLCAEDYHWWWMSLAVGASPSIYVFGYAMIYYWISTDIHGLTGATVYIVHTLVACSMLGLCLGALGFFSTYSMVRKIYAVVKMD